MYLLPPIHPHNPHPLCLPTTHHPNFPDNRNHPNQQPTPNQHPHAAPTQPHSLRTPLTVLASDEALISYRKRALARYGANWLRPPGVLKTLQGQDDERAEREEAELQREQEARAQAEMMRAQELEAEEEEEMGEGEGGEGEGEGLVDLDAEVPDADAEGEEWSSDDEEDDEEGEGEADEEEEEEEEEQEAEEEEGGMRRQVVDVGRPIGMGMFDGPSTPVQDDRTPQRFRLNPFQAPTAEGDGDYGSPLAARHMQRAAAAAARVGEISPGVMAAMARRGGGQGTQPGTVNTLGVGMVDMEADLDDAIPMDETMIDDGSFEHTESEVEEPSSEDEALPGGSVGVGSRSVFRTGAIGAAVRRISGHDKRTSGVQRRVSGAGGDRRVSGDRRASGRAQGHGGREN